MYPARPRVLPKGMPIDQTAWQQNSSVKSSRLTIERGGELRISLCLSLLIYKVVITTASTVLGYCEDYPAMAGRFCTPELPGNPGRAQRALQMRGEKSPGNLVLSLLRRASEAQRMSAARPRPSAVSPPHLCSAVPQELPCLSPCGIGQCAGPGSSQTRES